MPLGLIRVDPNAFPPEPMACLRCGQSAPMRFAGPCPACAGELREKYRRESRTIHASYDPKMNVTPNAVALKE